MTPIIYNQYGSPELAQLRRAVDANCFKGGPSIFATALRNDRIFRIVGVRSRRGTVYGQELSCGKWRTIRAWETRP